MSGMDHGSAALSWLFEPVLLAAAVAYLLAVVVVYRRGGWWPAERTACWTAGMVAAATALTGPLAEAADQDFTAHMAGHLLLGMTAPLLFVLAAPVTLALRAVPVRHARALSHVLGSRPVRVITHPVTATLLNAGALWVLYTTDLYRAMGEHLWVHVVVHVHIVAAGYLFTAAIVGVDPAPHRPGMRTRATVLMLFLAAHPILAKYLYGHPPAGVLPGGSAAGAELMYYGGDLIDVALILVFCRQWYRSTDPHRRTPTVTPRIGTTRPASRPWRLPEEIRTGQDPGAAGS